MDDSPSSKPDLLRLDAVDPQGPGGLYGVAGMMTLLGLFGMGLGVPALALLLFGFAALIAWSGRSLTKLVGQGIVLDEEGVGPAMEGVRLWTLPWERYGGIRVRPASFKDSLRQVVYEVLDRSGQPVFAFRSQASSHARTAAFEELDRRVPADGFPRPRRDGYRLPKKRNVWINLGITATMAGVSAWGFGQPFSSSGYVVGPIALLVAVGTGLAATFEGVHLVRRARGWRPPELPRGIPEEGPALPRHLARHERNPLTLVEGRRYRTVDPARRRAELETQRTAARTMVGAGFAVAGAVLVATLFIKGDPGGAWSAAPWWAVIGGFGMVGVRAADRRLKSLDDVLWVHDGHLVVVRSEGEPLVLSLPDGDERAALRRLGFWGTTDRWRLPDGTRYGIDRTRLYEAPSEIGE